MTRYSKHGDQDEPLSREVHSLADAALRGEISPGEASRLESLVLENREARRRYLEFIDDSHSLSRWAGGKRSAIETRPSVSVDRDINEAFLIELLERSSQDLERSSQDTAAESSVSPKVITPVLVFLSDRASQAGEVLLRPPVLSVVLAVATLACVIVGLMLTPLSEILREDNRSQQTADAQPVARLTALDSARWESDGVSPAPGDRLHEGIRLRLAEGTAQIEFDDGAMVVLCGPASLQVLSASSAYLDSGSLAARVPPRAHGFMIQTSAANLVDLGTEFSVRVDDHQASLIRVFVGQVEIRSGSKDDAHQSGKNVQRLVAGQSLKVLPTGETAPMQPVEAQFARFETLQPIPSRLLFQDRFDASSDGVFVLRNDHDRRRAQNGTLVKTDTLRYATDGNPRLRSGGGQQKQGLLTLAKGAMVSPNLNLNTADIETAGGFVVEFDFSNLLLDDHDLMRWVGLRLFADETTRTGSWRKFDGVHFHLRGNGLFSFYEEGLKRTSVIRRPAFTDTGQGWHHVRVEVRIKAFDGQSPAHIRAFANGAAKPFYEHTTNRGYETNFLTLEYESSQGGDLAGYGLVDRFRVLLLKKP